jgi:hypothetical protein
MGYKLYGPSHFAICARPGSVAAQWPALRLFTAYVACAPVLSLVGDYGRYSATLLNTSRVLVLE